MHDSKSPAELAAALTGVGYLPAEGLAISAFLAMQLKRPLFLEGEPGVGKTALAAALAGVTGGKLIRLQCYEGIAASQALFDWDFRRQLLALRSSEDGDRRLYSERFLIPRPILKAYRKRGSVLLIDEIDRADEEFEAFLLEVLSEAKITIPELKNPKPTQAPIVVLTSNRTREVHDALKRRCFYHWIDHPDLALEAEIIRGKLDGSESAARLAAEVAKLMVHIRGLPGLDRRPGVAEAIDLAMALVRSGVDSLSAKTVLEALGAVVKSREDQLRVQATIGDFLSDPPSGQ
jgi:MoxR-like ATPase